MPQYRGRTTFIITADHGRGSGLERLEAPRRRASGSDGIWIAVIGPRTPAFGARANIATVTQSQIAATIAELLGEDYRKFSPRAASPLPVGGAPAPPR